MKSFVVASLTILIIGLGAWQLQGDPPAQTGPDRLKPFMQRKLDHAKQILEGLALEDYDKIAKNAQDLSLLSLESNWNVLTTEEYLDQSSDFRRSVNVIRSAALEKDINRAALGYVNLTVRCVECHSYLRSKKNLPEQDPTSTNEAPKRGK